MINTVSITDLKQNTADVVKRVKTSGKSVVIIQRSEPSAVLVDPDYFQMLEEALEDLEDLKDIELRKNEPRISMHEYLKKRFGKKSSQVKLLLFNSAQKDFDKLPDDITLRISKKLYDLAINPYIYGSEKLAGNKGYRIRIGDYRIVYKIDKSSKEVTLIKVKHRREVYR